MDTSGINFIKGMIMNSKRYAFITYIAIPSISFEIIRMIWISIEYLPATDFKSQLSSTECGAFTISGGNRSNQDLQDLPGIG